MKTRIGFVSNSSSTSFMLVGASYPRGQYTREDFVATVGTTSDGKYADEDSVYGENMYRLVFVDDGEDGAPEGKLLIGRRTDLDDDSPDMYTELSEMEETIKQITEMFVNPHKVGLFTGRRLT